MSFHFVHFHEQIKKSLVVSLQIRKVVGLLKFKLSFNSPVVLGFVLISAFALLLDTLTGGRSTFYLFSVHGFRFFDPLSCLRTFTHVFGHGDWSHFFGNMTLFLLIGPLLEEKYGSADFSLIILTTAFVTGIIHAAMFPNIQLMGASGVVFALIIVASLAGIKDNKIPLTFLLIFVIYMGQEFYNAFFVTDNISQLSHIIGAFVGAALGFGLKR